MRPGWEDQGEGDVLGPELLGDNDMSWAGRWGASGLAHSHTGLG